MDALDPRVTISNPLAANDMKTPHPNHPNRNRKRNRTTPTPT
jgi:hypothetical protein